MKALHLTGLFSIVLIGSSFADETAATITQASGPIAHASSATGAGQSAGAGTALRSGEFVRTGKTSLAEMVLDNQTVTRVGPNTVLSYTAGTHEADLHSGTILFSKPKDGTQLTIKMPGVTAAVTGTTGFVERDDKGVIFGVIEGTVHVTVGSASAILQAGKMLVAVGSDAQVVSFDVPDFVATSAFFNRFQRALPNEKSVQHEIAQYNNLVARGFIAPVKVALASGDHHDGVAADRTGHESAGKSSAVPDTSMASSSGSSSAGVTLNGGMNGAASASLSKIGSGASNLSIGSTGAGTSTAGATSYTGGTTVSGGTLALNGNGNTAGGTGILGVASTAGTISLGGGTAGALTGSSVGGSISANSYGAGATLSVASGSTTFSGVTTIASAGTLNGGGTLTLGGAFGSGTVSGGILSLNGSTLTISNGTANFGSITGVTNGTLVNTTGSPITIGGVTIPAHGTVTVH